MTQQFHFWDISKETQNTNSKEYIHPYVQYSILAFKLFFYH